MYACRYIFWQSVQFVHIMAFLLPTLALFQAAGGYFHFQLCQTKLVVEMTFSFV